MLPLERRKTTRIPVSAEFVPSDADRSETEVGPATIRNSAPLAGNDDEEDDDEGVKGNDDDDDANEDVPGEALTPRGLVQTPPASHDEGDSDVPLVKVDKGKGRGLYLPSPLLPILIFSHS